MDSSVRLRPATPADLDAISDLLALVFHEPLSDARRETHQAMLEPDRSIVAEDGETVVGHATALTRDLTVPGAVVPAAHVAEVGVAPTHRRRGLLTAMMHRQLGELADAGREPIAVLWASESGIYPRYGYGPAAARLSLEVMNREVRLPRPPADPVSRLRLVEPLSAIGELDTVYERLRPGRIGWSSRGQRWWRFLLADLTEPNDAPDPLRCVLYERADGPHGYALWRARSHSNTWGPDGRVEVREVMGDDAEAYAELWRFLLDIDLVRTVEFPNAAVDDPLQYWVGDPRRLGRRLLDALWVRLVDLPAALEARDYATSVDAVFDVSDPILQHNTGRWRLAGGPGKVTCTRTDDAPDFACSITELGAAYLGGTSLAALAAAGRIRRLTGNLPSAAFGTDRLPNPVEMF